MSSGISITPLMPDIPCNYYVAIITASAEFLTAYDEQVCVPIMVLLP